MERFFLITYIVVSGVFCDDQIGPKQNQDIEVFHHEGQPVTLECSYESSSQNVYLYWYRQYPNKAPQYLLYKGARSQSGEHTSDGRFSSATTERSTQLTISGLTLADTALYYCALRTQGCDYIEQSEELMTASEGDAAVLKCEYNTEDQSPCLLWYKQQRNGFPKFVLMNLTFGQGHTELEIKARFSGNLDSKSSSVPLRIQKLHVIDSAVYYCALMSTLTTTHSPLIQKHETGITEHSWS
ncbi:uncharacterized protein LOC118242986 [Electrophorus electricus]|uniref:uncharacterized protein LOC118242986 n=1 Tax=Electrophorus electricus TaxID=8005 RepID=UPI0015CFB9EA|nr:uncharacterized protein LOC118242986 [Electrophorus electricus]